MATQCYWFLVPEDSAQPILTNRIMIHQPLSGVQGQASDIEIEAKEIQKIQETLYNHFKSFSYSFLIRYGRIVTETIG